MVWEIRILLHERERDSEKTIGTVKTKIMAKYKMKKFAKKGFYLKVSPTTISFYPAKRIEMLQAVKIRGKDA